MKFDIDSARKAGYSDNEIAEYLASENKFDLSGAMQSGYSARDVIDFLSQPKGGKQDLPADVTPSAGRSAEFAATDPRRLDRQQPGLVDRAIDAISSFLPKPADPMGVASGKPLGNTPIQAQAAPAERPKAKPYRNRIEALDDAVNLVEEGVDLSKVSEAFSNIGIKPEEIVAHAQKRGSDYFKQQATPAVETEVQRLLKRAPAPEPTGEIKPIENDYIDDAINLGKRVAARTSQSFTNTLLQVGAISEEGAARSFARDQKKIEGAAPPESIQEGMRAIGGSKTYGEAALNLASNPAATFTMLTESLLQTAPQLALAVSRLPKLARVAGTGAFSGALEFGSTMADVLADRGIDMTNADAVSRALRDDSIRSEIRQKGETRGLTIGVIDALTAGFAGKFIEPVKETIRAGKLAEQAASRATIGAWSKELGLQVAGGSGGEALAQSLTGENKPADVLMEGLAEGFSAPFEVRGNLREARELSPNAQIARAMDQEIANTDWATPASEVAADLMSPNAYDQRLISPAETTRPATTTNFTPADSPTAEAGLVPIVVPVPDAPVAINPETEKEFGLDKLRMGATDVSTGSAADAQPAVGSVAGGDQSGRGMDVSGSDVTGNAGQLGGRAGEPAVNAAQAVAAGDTTAQPVASVTPAGYNNAVEPRLVEPWFGRKGGGYSTQADAQQAIAGRQRMFPGLEWKIERMPNGKFMLGGYDLQPQETNLGNQAPQTQQAETQGQEARAGASTAAAAGATTAPAKLQDSGVSGLRLAPTAPLRDFGTFQKAVAADGIEIAPLRVSEMNDTHKLASVVARLLGKTYTVARVTSGDPLALSNGMVDKLGGKHIVAAENADDAPLFVAMHEAYHGLPAAQRKALNVELLKLFRAENKDRFLQEFNYTEAQFEEEAPAFMAQVLTKRADFWEDLRTKMGNKEFGEVAKAILGTLNNLLRKVSGQYGQDFADTYISDIVKARDLLTTAYAEAMQAQGLQADTEVDSGVMASNKGEDIGAKLQAKIDADFDATVREYNAIKETEGGRVLDVDLARELSPEYRENRTRAPEVHEAASAFIEKLFEQRVKAAAETGGLVAFKAGGGGAGKSSANAIAKNELRDAHTILDGTLSTPSKAERLINMVFDNNQTAVVVYIYREPVDALANREGGVLKRAMETRRTVPIDSLVKTHSGSNETMRMLDEEFGNDRRFAMLVVNNSFGFNNAQPADLADITPVIKSGLKEKLREATDQAYAEGFIDQEIYERTIGTQPASSVEVANSARQNGQTPAGEVQGRSGSQGQEDTVSRSNKAKAETAADHKLSITREERELADKTKLTRDELAKIKESATRFNLAPRTVEMEVRRIKSRFPESAGWAPLEFLRVDPKVMEKKAKEGNPLPSDAIFFVEQPYQFHLDPKTGSDTKATHDQRVKAIGSALAGEIMEKYMAAQRGDPVAKIIMRQSDWYRALRSKLRATFGGFGDFFAQLLGPTSANNPVEPNFKYAVEALKLATSGKWDNMFKEIAAWRAEIDAAAINLDAVIAEVKAAGGKGWKTDPRVVDAMKALKDAAVYKGTLPKRENGKMFGMATNGIVQILGESWGDKQMGDAPKTKNYYQNIVGRTIDATIDVWAARTLRRLANDQVGNFPRIPTVAEGAVAGSVLADNVTSGSEFGFGQDVFREAAAELKSSGIAKFSDVTPDAVQAMIWFAEKELWARRGWTSKIGEEGSIEHELLLAGYGNREQVDKWRSAARAGRPNPDSKVFQLKDADKAKQKYEKAVAEWSDAKQVAEDMLAQIERYPDRFVGGITLEIPGDKPTNSEMANAGRELDNTIGDAGVIAKRAQTTTGEFMGDYERTIDLEFVVRNGYNPTPVWNKMVQVSDREGQMATFLSRTLRQDELENIDYTRHRPGIELYFAKPISKFDAAALMAIINSAGVHGMTLATEGRRTVSSQAGEDQPVVGIRMQHIPEFMLGYGYEANFTNAIIEENILAARDKMVDLVDELGKRYDVSTATFHWYETKVHFYGINEGTAAAGSAKGDSQAWRGQSIRQGLADAARFARENQDALGARRAELLGERALSRGNAGQGSIEGVSDGQVDGDVQYSRRVKPDPKKTVTAYKLFRTEADRPGELFPLFVPVWGDSGPQKFGNRDPRRHGEGVPMGVWYDAEVGESAAATKTGKPQVKSKLGGLAFRPGWHAGDLPIATHIGEMSDPGLKAPDLRAPNQVWAEVELPNDVDWQTEANKRGINKKGALIAREAHITDQIPVDGFYRYKTNSNMTGNWLIGGSMKVNRILSDAEVKAINDAAGTADLPRAKPFDSKKYGFDTEDVNSPFTVVRSNRVAMAPIEEPGQFDAKPGDSITVVRLASMQGLDNTNAASVKGLYTFLSMIDDNESAAGSEAGISDTVFVYKVKVPEAGFGQFSRARGGRMLDGEGAGRMNAKWGGYWYSFPQGTEAELLGSIPLTTVRETAKTTKGSSNFDFLGTDAGSEAIGQAFKDAGFDFDAGGVMFSKRVSLADDAAAQERFLQSKAEEAGYADVDEFMDKDYDGFVAAAKQWREDNPADVMFSNRARDSWFIGRDELGRPTLGAGAKAYRVAADLANNVLDRFAMKPISKDLSRAMRKMKMEIEQARLLTADAADHLSKLDENERAMISDVIEGELKRGVKPPKRVLEVAASMQGIMSEQTAELVRLGMLSADAAGRWDGKYLPRFYESKLMDEGKKWVKAAKSILGRPRTMQGIKGSSLKGRGLFQTVPVEELEQWLAEGWQERDPKFNPDTDTEITIWRDYSREERENMGEIRDAMFRFVMGYTKSQQDIALGRLYEQLANTVASKHEQEGYVQVPSSNVEDTKARRYGKLAGKWVPQEVMDHLSATDNSMQSDVMKFYMKALSMWKEGKTVLNPVSHANNVLSNLTAAHFAGVSYWDVHKYVGATRDLVKQNPMVREAQDAGLFGGTMTQAELVDMLPDQLKVLAARTESKAGQAVEGVWNAMSFWLRKPLGKAYQAEDQFFRYLIYRDARERGLEPDDAVEYAQKFIFTYDDLPKGARMVRNFAMPFFSYTYKVVPMLAQTALETPWRYLAPAAAIYTANAIAYAFAAGAGEDDDDWMSLIKRYVMDPDFRAKAKAIEEDERKNLPSWMKGASLTLGTSKAIRLGVDEATDLPVFLDVSRMFPGGDLFDAQNNAGGVPLLAPITPNNPMLTAASAILFNKDSFTGKEIVKKTDTSGEAAAKRAEWAWKQFSPAIAVGNYHFDRAMNVIANVTGEPVNLGFKEYTGVARDGTPVQAKYAAMQTVGIKARPIDLELSAKIDKSQTDAMIRDMDSQIRSLRRLNSKGAISDAAMEKETEVLREKRQRLKEGLTVDGEEK